MIMEKDSAKCLVKWFTLVELIVVITILAILGTIAFISLNWYALSARNSKKVRELQSISSEIPVHQVKGVTLLAFVANTGSTITGTNIKIAGYNEYDSFSGSYKAWDINKTAFKWSEAVFTDSVFNEPYKIGVSTIGWYNETVPWYWSFELAATLEWNSELDTLIVWNWENRVSAIVRAARDPVLLIQDDIFYMTGQTYYETGLKAGDQVWIASGTYTIINFPTDYSIRVDRTVTTPWSNLYLRRNETRHLIKKWDSNFAIDTGSWDTYTPYN